jgi:hypothetical protein
MEREVSSMNSTRTWVTPPLFLIKRKTGETEYVRNQLWSAERDSFPTLMIFYIPGTSAAKDLDDTSELRGSGFSGFL